MKANNAKRNATIIAKASIAELAAQENRENYCLVVFLAYLLDKPQRRTNAWRVSCAKYFRLRVSEGHVFQKRSVFYTLLVKPERKYAIIGFSD